MRKILIIILCLCFFLSGCESVYPSSLKDKEPHYLTIKYDWYADIINIKDVYETKSELYYVGKKGIMKLNKETKDAKLIVKGNYLSIHYFDDFLYFDSLNEDTECIDSIYRCDVNGANQEKVLDLQDISGALSTEYLLIDKISNNCIYLEYSGVDYAKYDMDLKTVEHFLTTKHEFCFKDEYLYTGLLKSFCIYKVSLRTGEEILLRGIDTEEKPLSEYYENVYLFNGEIYYTKRFPVSLYKLNESGDDELILLIDKQGASMSDVYIGYNKLYIIGYNREENAKYDQCVIEYDPVLEKTQEINVSGIDATLYWAVIDNTLIYYTSNYEQVIKSL